jgi:hypothetical protein
MVSTPGSVSNHSKQADTHTASSIKQQARQAEVEERLSSRKATSGERTAEDAHARGAGGSQPRSGSNRGSIVNISA